jgi:3-hydroxyacyl-CoA dehydrogenase/enoyl-CoA hydratase/3-hydroxybutyryl-CoA epimerase
VSKILHQAFGDRLGTPDLLEKFVEEGRLGRKSKKGFYTYDGKKKRVDQSVYALIPYGTHRKSFDREEMAQRCALQLVNEAARCLEENVLRNPRDGDVGAIFGLGFPAYLGGPFRYADSLGPSKVVDYLEHWQDKLGDRFEPAPLLLDLAKQHQKFYRD